MTVIKSIFLSFTIWVLTALLNACLGGTWLSVFSNEFSAWQLIFLQVFVCTLFFSVPGMFIFWIVLLVNWEQERLFRVLLKTAFVVSILSSVILYFLPVDVVDDQQFFLSLCVVIASIASIMIHHSTIKTISANKN